MTIQELISLFARNLRRFNDVDVVQMAGLAEGTSTATLKVTNPIVYFLNNQQISNTIVDNIPMTACTQQPISSFCYYLVSIDTFNVITVTKGSNNTYALPSTPAGTVAIGAFKVVTDGSHTFTSGTTDLSAAGITAAFFDIDVGIALTLINQAMKKLERGIVVSKSEKEGEVRISNFDHMKTRAQVPLVSGNYQVTNPFPTYKELISANITDSNGRTYPELTRAEFNTAMTLFPSLTTHIGRPVTISRVPAVQSSFSPVTTDTLNFILRPTCDVSYTLDMLAYQYSPSLDGVIYSNNWWTDNAFEVLLYGALVEAAAYLPQDSRIPVWQGLYTDAVAGLVTSQRLEKKRSEEPEYRF